MSLTIHRACLLINWQLVSCICTVVLVAAWCNCHYYDDMDVGHRMVYGVLLTSMTCLLVTEWCNLHSYDDIDVSHPWYNCHYDIDVSRRMV